MTRAAAPAALAASVPALWAEVTRAVTDGARLADLFATARPDGLLLTARLVAGAEVSALEVMLPPGPARYPALTPCLPAAFWYEREIHDLFGIVPEGHPRLQPLLRPPGVLPAHVAGPGLFTIPHGPVRSGVVESIEYLVETPGEEIPHLSMRIFYKHRGIEQRFEGLPPGDGVLLAERVEGTASVAHALAYCHALEQITGTGIPRGAALIRTVHAELSRLACHLDVALRLADGAGLAVATARLGWHKERVLRLVSRLCGSRFGRGVVVPGGVSGPPLIPPAGLLGAVADLDRQVTPDLRLLMGTASFLDRLRRTGPLRPGRAREHGALGPVGRASGTTDDARQARPGDAYEWLPVPVVSRAGGDAMARLEVRVEEIAQSFRLVRQAAGELAGAAGGPLRARCDPADGRAAGWAEAPQGEVLYDVRLESGRIRRCRARSASFHNLVLMHEVFAGDVLTDFPFIEASFGLSVAGAAR
ncbi:MAG: NADH-quinone oxidoreductase subunit C [Streptosporangiaceae bacterium]